MNEESIVSRIIQNNKRASGTLIYEDLLEAYEYFDGKCPYSETPINEKNWHLEHIIPVTLGGTTDPWNCIPVCGPCNLSKGSKHLLDWWDETHKLEEEYRLEKVFCYLINALNKERTFKISEQKDIDKLNELMEQSILEETQNLLEEDISSKKLDTFTFLYQLLNHLKDSKQIEESKMEEYKIQLQQCYDKNQNFERLDIEEYQRQYQLTKYLKQIGVLKHYVISYHYSNQIKDFFVLGQNIKEMSEIDYLNTNPNTISSMINKNPDILLLSPNEFQEKMKYLIETVHYDKNIVIKLPSLLNEIELAEEFVKVCDEVGFDINNMTNAALGRGKLKNFIEILRSEEFQKYPDLFTSQVLAKSTPERIQEIIHSEEFQKYPDLFTSTVLAQSTPERIKEIIHSEEFQKYPDLFTSQVLAQSTPERIKEIIRSEEFQKYPDLFTSEVLAHSTPERIQSIIQSEEFKKYPQLFTSQVLAKSTPERIQSIIQSEEFKTHSGLFTSEVLAFSTPERIQSIIQSEEFKKYPQLFTSTVLAHSTPERIQSIIQSEEFKKYPQLFTSQVLAKSTPERIQSIIQSEEFKTHSDLFTTSVLALSTPERIKEIIHSEEFQKYPDLFTSQVLAKSTPERIKEIIHSEEFQKYPDLFTSQVLAHSTPERIKEIIHSEEFQKYPDLFTSEVLADSTPERIKEIIHSEEFQKYPDLFTSTVLAHSTPERIKEIIHSEEFQKYPELFTSTVVAYGDSENIKTILSMPFWEDSRYQPLLTSSLLLKRAEGISLNIQIAESFSIEEFLNTNYMIKSPSQNFALLSYLSEQKIPVVQTDRLHPSFYLMPGKIKQRFDIDLKELIQQYPIELFEERTKKNGIR